MLDGYVLIGIDISFKVFQVKIMFLVSH